MKDVPEGSSLQERLGQREVRPDRIQGINQSIEAGRQPSESQLERWDRGESQGWMMLCLG